MGSRYDIAFKHAKYYLMATMTAEMHVRQGGQALLDAVSSFDLNQQQLSRDQ